MMHEKMNPELSKQVNWIVTLFSVTKNYNRIIDDPPSLLVQLCSWLYLGNFRKDKKIRRTMPHNLSSHRSRKRTRRIFINCNEGEIGSRLELYCDRFHKWNRKALVHVKQDNSKLTEPRRCRRSLADSLLPLASLLRPLKASSLIKSSTLAL